MTHWRKAAAALCCGSTAPHSRSSAEAREPMREDPLFQSSPSQHVQHPGTTVEPGSCKGYDNDERGAHTLTEDPAPLHQLEPWSSVAVLVTRHSEHGQTLSNLCSRGPKIYKLSHFLAH